MEKLIFANTLLGIITNKLQQGYFEDETSSRRFALHIVAVWMSYTHARWRIHSEVELLSSEEIRNLLLSLKFTFFEIVQMI